MSKTWQRYLAALLCVALSPNGAMAQTPAAAKQSAGEVAAYRTSATRNAQPISMKESVQWNDTFRSDASGRLRIALHDGSSLSLGSNSELQVVQHDSATQQTQLQLLFGRVRSQVKALVRPGSRFEMSTPHAVLGVIGTDFYVEADGTSTKVIVYSGRVSITPKAAAAITLAAGQMVSVTSTGAGPVTSAPQSVVSQSVSDTQAEPQPAESGRSMGKAKYYWVAAAIAAATVGIVIGTTRGRSDRQ